MRRLLLSLLASASLAPGAGCPLRADRSPSVAATPEAVPTAEATAAPQPRPAPGGVVATAHPRATEAGMQMLRAGGTAFDAAVAAALVLGVVQPQSSGLGGGGFAVTWLGGAAEALDFREVAPSFFGPDTFADPARDPARGPWSVAVPGEAAGLARLHRQGGRLPWAELVEPARQAAADGFPVGAELAAAARALEDRVRADAGLAAFLVRADGHLVVEGDRCVRPALARTLEYLQLHGGQALYRGPLAVAISGHLAGRGVPWSESDLATYAPVARPPLLGRYRGATLATMPPPSSGGVALLQTLALLEARGPAEDAWSAGWSRHLAQALTHAFADRAAYGGDPDAVDVPVARLLAPELPGQLWAVTPARGPVPIRSAGLAAQQGDLRAVLPDDHGTSHLTVLAPGSAVALTTTVNLLFGSGIAEPQTGIVLNDEIDDFATRPGVPNAFGLVQGAGNAVRPGRRPLSSMTPTLVLRDGVPVAGAGGAGGPRIITATLQTLLGMLDRGESPAEAVAAPRLHTQWLPAEVLVEDLASGATLRDEGFSVASRGPLARVHCAARRDGAWEGGADPRGEGTALVWNP